nr:hypothetical protein [Deltaproteobacteria bacterium]
MSSELSPRSTVTARSVGTDQRKRTPATKPWARPTLSLARSPRSALGRR